MEIQKTILRICMERGFLLDKEILESLSVLDEISVREVIEKIGDLNIGERVITKQVLSKNLEKIKRVLINGKSKTVVEKFFINMGYARAEITGAVSAGEGEVKSLDGDESQEEAEEFGKVKLISAPSFSQKKIEVKDFINHFRARYGQLRKFLQEKELENLTSIKRIGQQRDTYSIIVYITSKRTTKNKNLLFEVEDLTGSSRVLVNQNKKEVFDKAKELLLDEVVAFQVSGNSEILFANDIIFPEAGLAEKKKYDKEELVAFTSDFHTGGITFKERNLIKFIKWLNGQEGDEKQRELAQKIKYLFVTGDVIDGVGVYPTQEKYLKIKETKQQYNKVTEILKLVRKDIKIIMCPGQHDAVWVGEPQPIIGEYWAPGLYEMENLILVPNPCLVEIDGGFKILMYHGASMHGIINEIDVLRLNHADDYPTRVVKEMLKRRHLAPMHGSVDYIPCGNQDPMVIDVIPDIVATGEMHKAEVSIHNNILLIASSCWQDITPFEEKVGNHPDPCKVPVFNLKTREIKILDFSDKIEEKLEKRLEKI